MFFQWKEFNATAILLLINSTFLKKDYADQVDWKVEEDNNKDNNDSDSDLIGEVSLTSANFTSIMDAALARNPNATFQFVDLSRDVVDDDSVNYHGASCPNTSGASYDETVVAKRIESVLGLFGQSALGLFGVCGNVLAVIVLNCGKRLRSVFNRILTCNLAVHSAYILASLGTEVYKEIGGRIFSYGFSNFLYAFKPMLLHTSTFLTVLMARERYKAIHQPVEYRNQVLGEGEWRRAKQYLLSCAAAAAIFVGPLLWETRVAAHSLRLRHEDDGGDKEDDGDDEEEHQQHQPIIYTLEVTKLRLNHHYILWYKNVATFVVTLLAPLVLLGYWNTRTYLLMQRTLANSTPRGSVGTVGAAAPPTAAAAAAAALGAEPGLASAHVIKREEEHKARILIVIILVFLLCNTLRFVLNLEECVAGRDYVLSARTNCSVHPYWALVANHCSNLLVCANASFGFVAYCVMSGEFRAELGDWWRRRGRC